MGRAVFRLQSASGAWEVGLRGRINWVTLKSTWLSSAQPNAHLKIAWNCYPFDAPREVTVSSESVIASAAAPTKNIQVSWQTPAGATPGSVAGFNFILINIDSSESWARTFAADVTEAQMRGLAPGQYQLSIAAIDQKGMRGRSRVILKTFTSGPEQ